jgi:hypothetical protein
VIRTSTRRCSWRAHHSVIVKGVSRLYTILDFRCSFLIDLPKSFSFTGNDMLAKILISLAVDIDWGRLE